MSLTQTLLGKADTNQTVQSYFFAVPILKKKKTQHTIHSFMVSSKLLL